MSFNKSPFAFDDIRALFDRALSTPKGIRIPCDSRGAAVLMRSRFNYFRALNRKDSLMIYEPGHPMHGRSVYDKLILRIPKRGTPQENTLIIEFHSEEDIIVEEIE